MNDLILSADNLTVQFGGVRACDSISFDVERRELFALVGPNGAGKTTLVNCITGVYEPLKGGKAELHLASGATHDLLSLRPHHITRLGLARTFQNLGVFEQQSVVDNLMLGRYNFERIGVLEAGLFTSRVVRKELEARRQVEKVIELLELGDYRWDLVGGLPYGVQKRVELGRVLAMEPELLLLDEPMAGMTSDEKRDMVRFIFLVMQEQETSVLLIEHDMGVVMSIADRVMVLDFGLQIALGTPEEVQDDENVIRAYLGTESES
jgi:branched-chain amino acid transport system ATP-binding protein